MRVTIPRYKEELSKSISTLKRSRTKVRTHAKVVNQAVETGKTHYGINTGFGALASETIDARALVELQTNLLTSHAAGVGNLISKELSKLILQLKIHALGLGHSGISEPTFLKLIELLEKDLIPAVPEQGSVGASGDLAPLSHLALPLLGKGEIWDSAGSKTLPASKALKTHAVSPIELKPKEGLALINGTQFMSAYGVYALERALKLLKTADIVAAMSIEAIRASHQPFKKCVQDLRPHSGQSCSAKNLRAILKKSEIAKSHADCSRVQDPYSFRCAAVVNGASRTAILHAAEVVETEINSVTDNPLVFDDGSIISAGNFHGQPLALAFDYAAMAIAEIASISERRTYFLLSGHDDLPELLIDNKGLQSGFMIPQYTSAALVSENKVLCHPASVDSIPTSLGQEDHVSMGSISAVKLLKVLENAEKVLGIEMLCAAQGLDFRSPLTPGVGVKVAHEFVREKITHRRKSREFKESLESAFEIVSSATLLQKTEKTVGALK